MTGIDWQPWATPPFQRARRRRLPVLLFLSAGWAPGCRDLDEHFANNPAARLVVSERFVPIRVDVDWRPDIADRYGLESWPTLLALTPEGHVLAGGLPNAADLTGWLSRTAETFACRDGSLATHTAAGRADQDLPVDDDAEVRAETWGALALALDPECGAFGTAGQPSIAPALAGLAGIEVGVTTYGDCALRTVDLLLDSPRWNQELGVLRVRGASAWERGADLARLEEQAEWVRLLVHASRLAPDARGDAALDVAVRALQTCFGGSGPAWQPWTGGPDVVFVDAMARACRALLLASAWRGEAPWAREAITVLEAVLPQVYARGAGLAHVLSTRAHGPMLLGDAMLTAHALLDADAWRADPVYRDLAEELLLDAEARLRQPGGALADRRRTMAGANDVGRLADVLCPIEGNAEAARLSIRLASEAPHPSPAGRDRARRLLRGIHADVRLAGGFAAPAALAWAAYDSPDGSISVW